MTDADPTTLQGGCLCGRVRYEVTPESDEGYYCHCRMCQLAFGNTRVPFLNVPKASVRWLTEPPKHYASSSFALRGFCPDCGTPLSFEYRESARMDLSVGSLDEPSRVRPVSHFAIETRIAAWHADDGLPGTRLDEHQRLMQRWKDAYGEGVVPGIAATRGA
ncbi:GFA family protein [uncultured Piscinibacter sp.]|uniref:GFA family protein n=1 Tax=uncultured Piscinibacter sp. TaxID=1131835 RepID=UPI00260427C1|nr:GFA family protein [uncultured Piscinibacter sp.]